MHNCLFVKACRVILQWEMHTVRRYLRIGSCAYVHMFRICVREQTLSFLFTKGNLYDYYNFSTLKSQTYMTEFDVNFYVLVCNMYHTDVFVLNSENSLLLRLFFAKLPFSHVKSLGTGVRSPTNMICCNTFVPTLSNQPGQIEGSITIHSNKSQKTPEYNVCMCVWLCLDCLLKTIILACIKPYLQIKCTKICEHCPMTHITIALSSKGRERERQAEKR